MDMSNVNDNNDNNASITWDDVVAMEDPARDLTEVPAPLLLIYFVQARLALPASTIVYPTFSD